MVINAIIIGRIVDLDCEISKKYREAKRRENDLLNFLNECNQIDIDEEQKTDFFILFTESINSFLQSANDMGYLALISTKESHKNKHS
jgi:hypothetical protein